MICGVYAVLGGYLIAAARKPSENRSLISFTIWANVVQAGIRFKRPGKAAGRPWAIPAWRFLTNA
jgi:hypothetical protein